MKNLKKKLFFGIISILLSIISYADISYAVSISPSRGEVVVEPGKEYIGEYTVTNNQETPMSVSIFADPWFIKKDRDATSWIKVWPNEVTIPANSSEKIKFSVKAPKGVEGEYNSSIVFRDLTSKQLGGIGAVTQLRVAMYVVIKGTEIVKGEISNIEILNTEPLKASVKVKNFGNIHVRPKGELKIIRIEKTKAGFKEEWVLALTLNPIEGPIFPDSEGDIGPKSDIILEPGNYKAKVKAEFTPEVILEKELEFTVPEKEGQVE